MILPHPRSLAASLAVAFLLLGSCNRHLGEPAAAPQLYEISSAMGVDTAAPSITSMEATIQPYATKLEAVMNRVLAEVETPLLKGQPESNLGNWTADLLALAAHDLFPEYELAFAVQNYGGLRVSEIGAGPLLVSEIYGLMPFDNELVLVEVTGADLRAFVTHTLLDGGWPVSANLRAERQGTEVTMTVDGKPVDDTQTYYIAAPDYVANGGSDSAMLVGKRQISSGKMIRDLLIEYAGKSQGPISVGSDGQRIKISNQ
ncbi:2',3'-cyclic-nucleotide 2'-phosphodiesterase (5'-nucleotidase family) [Lewinella aquimaris]|uniref:2',3'-cyclic-nucleotide 2'-phosphodiesterase (5'-nucleotidase family) n=1 Tax=Neolewinella aquimaris TaxID=1835722 RepID=A0A840E350_9BACT|nr:5'-nucleotidase C-terminal domain-containing protein [Neolewinella aquimaris]MBB4078095.1 2',3'-cyclic-nucleotide 2'-phosphodiesterase (5'-nucleotidase family) [Neolewinella aquimaris]